MKWLLKFIFILLAGAIGGVLASQFLVPYLSHTLPFDKVSWLKQVSSGTTIINPREEKIIREDTAVENAISRLNSSAVGIIAKSKPAKGKKPAEVYGTGFIVASDGLVVASAATIPVQGFDVSVIKNGETLSAEIKKRDDKAGLVLLKVEKTNLPVVSFVDIERLRLGARVVLVGVDAGSDPATKFVNWGIVRTLRGETFDITIESEEVVLSGAPLLNTEGLVAGMAIVDEGGKIKIIIAEEIKKFVSSLP